MRWPYTTMLAVSLAAAGCTRASLISPIGTPILPTLELVATACAPEDVRQQVPYRVLFVIDTSGSNQMQRTDPCYDPATGADLVTHRERAVRGFIQSHLSDENVAFGIITFSDMPHVQTFGFTRDTEALNAATQNVGTCQGGTNYSDTLFALNNFIEVDKAQLERDERRQAHYIVFWVSDGMPTVGTTAKEGLVPMVSTMRRALLESRDPVAEFRLNTGFIAGDQDPLEAAKAREILQAMATAGGGTFVNVSAGQEFQVEVVIETLERHFTLAYEVASNRNVVFAPPVDPASTTRPSPRADSDGDLMPDDAEEQADLDAGREDSDGDGIRDGVELMLGPSYSPRVQNGTCAPGDADGDGLSDCEEGKLGSDPGLVDTDGDFVPDEIEAAMAGPGYPVGLPMVDSRGKDTDGDGTPDVDEMRAHMPPNLPNTADEFDQWSYGYSRITMPAEQSQAATGRAGARCWRISVDNITLQDVAAAGSHEAHTNEIELMIAFEPEGGGGPAHFQRASGSIAFASPGGKLVFEPRDFKPVGRR